MNQTIEQSLLILIETCSNNKDAQEHIAKIEGYMLGLEQALKAKRINNP